MLVSLFLGALVGAVLGLTGAGGGILAVPALVVGMGWQMPQATPVALIAVAGSAAIGALEAFKRRLVRYRAALLMTLAGVPLTSVGVRLSHVLPERLLMALFSAAMLVVALRLLSQALRKATSKSTSRLCVGRVDPNTGRLVWNRATGTALAATGALTGLMTGLLGVGGGFVIVPLLRKFTNVSMHGIVATSLLVITLVGSGGIVSTLLLGASPPLALTLMFSVTTAVGMIIGRYVSRYLSTEHVQVGFAAVLICVALGLMTKAALGA